MILKSTSFRLWNGNYIDVADPNPDAFDLLGLAIQLSRIVRFGGATVAPYSVAQHSILVVQILQAGGCDTNTQRIGLLHDAEESVTSDIPSPIKQALSSSARAEVRRIAVNLRRAIGLRFGVRMPEELPRAVEEADMMALSIEKRDVRRQSNNDGTRLANGWPTIGALTEENARDVFIRVANGLGIFDPKPTIREIDR